MVNKDYQRKLVRSVCCWQFTSVWNGYCFTKSYIVCRWKLR